MRESTEHLSDYAEPLVLLKNNLPLLEASLNERNYEEALKIVHAAYRCLLKIDTYVLNQDQ